MTKRKVRTYRSETLRHSLRSQGGALTLSPLKMILTTARKDLPPQVSKKDVNEELALRLIEKMRTEYGRVFRGMVKANV